MRRDIWDEIDRMKRQMDSMFNNFLGEDKPFLEGPTTSKDIQTRTPLSDIYEDDKQIKVEAELPGVKKDDIDINILEDGVEVKVDKSDETKYEDKEKGMHRIERSSSSFYRYIPLPEEADKENVIAKYEDGLLDITFPKKKTSKKKKVNIQ